MSDRNNHAHGAMIIAGEATIRVDQSGIASVDELHSTEQKRFTVL
jgi:hypothetical protein